jgi:DNA-binding transcriptional MerR regulator
MSPTEPPRYTLTELAALAGVTPRTVRYYIAQGLLPAAPSAGPGAKYGDAHLARLRLIRRLQRDHQPLAAIRHQVGRLDDAMVLTLDAVPGEAAPAPDSALDYVRRLLSAAPAPQSVAPAPSSGPSAPSMRAPPEPAPMMKQLPSAPAPAMPPPPSAPTLTAPPPAPLQPVRSQWERIVLGPDVELHVRRPLTRSQSKRVDRLIAIGRELLEEDPT